MEYIHKLPDDNSIPGFPEWKYIHTPGHTPGHVSLFREKDKVLIAGDAFVTTKSDVVIFPLNFIIIHILIVGIIAWVFRISGN